MMFILAFELQATICVCFHVFATSTLGMKMYIRSYLRTENNNENRFIYITCVALYKRSTNGLSSIYHR